MSTVHLRTIVWLPFGLLVTTATPAAAGPAPTPDDPYADAPTPDDPYADARARTPSEPPWKVEQRREALYREGQALAQQERWQEALDKLREVKKIRSDPRLLLWMGFPEEQLGHLLKAKSLYLQAQKDAQAAKLKREAEDAAQALTALTPQIPRIILHLPRTEDASVYLDSARISFQEEGWEVDPGKHTVSVVWPQRPAFQAEVLVKVSEVSTVEVVVPKEITPPLAPRPVVQAPDVKASTGSPREGLVLGSIGVVVAVIGGVILGVTTAKDDGVKTSVGVMTLLTGVGVGIGGFGWYFSGPSSTSPSNALRRTPGAAPQPPSAMRAPIYVQVAPSPQGVWTSISGQF